MQYRAYWREKSLVGLQIADCIPVVTPHILLQIHSYTMLSLIRPFYEGSGVLRNMN